MSRERLSLFDTTLRDGAQTTGVDFSLDDKRAIALMLDELGIDYVEGGYPGANPLDTAFFAEPPALKARLTAFGMTKRPGRSAANDPGIAGLLDAKASAVCFVAKAWSHQVRLALGIEPEENLEGIQDSLAAAGARGRETLLDCEHFFDGFAADPAYALSVARTAYEAGARWVVLCDTNGGTLPDEVERVVRIVAQHVPGSHLGIHAHNDTEQAVANSLAAVRAGVRQVQGTLNGLGERCGNTNLTALIPTLLLKPALAERFETGVGPGQLAMLTRISRALDERLNRTPDHHAAYVGSSAFATKAGIHASALVKDPASYEHVPPEATGNRRKVLVSDQAGRSNLLAELDRLGLSVAPGDPRIGRLLDSLKAKEAEGYAFEGADASFYLLARRLLGGVPEFFCVERYSVNVERRWTPGGSPDGEGVAEAFVKVRVGDEQLFSAAEGNGPVNALDQALRKDLGRYQSLIGELKLVDFKVRIFQGGSDAVTRVLVEFQDGDGERWTTVGVSANIIDASFEALSESLTYKLLRSQGGSDAAPRQDDAAGLVRPHA